MIYSSVVSTAGAIEKLSMSSGGESDDMSFEIRADRLKDNAYYVPETNSRVYQKRYIVKAARLFEFNFYCWTSSSP